MHKSVVTLLYIGITYIAILNELREASTSLTQIIWMGERSRSPIFLINDLALSS